MGLHGVERRRLRGGLNVRLGVGINIHEPVASRSRFLLDTARINIQSLLPLPDLLELAGQLLLELSVVLVNRTLGNDLRVNLLEASTMLEE